MLLHAANLPIVQMWRTFSCKDVHIMALVRRLFFSSPRGSPTAVSNCCPATRQELAVRLRHHLIGQGLAASTLRVYGGGGGLSQYVAFCREVGAPTRSPCRSTRWSCSLHFGAFTYPRLLLRFTWPCLARPPTLPARWAFGRTTYTSATFSSQTNMFFAPSYSCSSLLVDSGAGIPGSGRAGVPPLDVAGSRPGQAGCCLPWCSAAVTPAVGLCAERLLWRWAPVSVYPVSVYPVSVYPVNKLRID